MIFLYVINDNYLHNDDILYSSYFKNMFLWKLIKRKKKYTNDIKLYSSLYSCFVEWNSFYIFNLLIFNISVKLNSTKNEINSIFNA